MMIGHHIFKAGRASHANTNTNRFWRLELEFCLCIERFEVGGRPVIMLEISSINISATVLDLY